MAGGTFQAYPGQVLVGSPLAKGGIIYRLRAEVGAIECESPSTQFRYQFLFQPEASTIEVGSNDTGTTLRVSRGIALASTLSLAVKSDYLVTRYFFNGSFPSIRPTSRQFIAPKHPVFLAYSLNHKASRTILASQPSKASLNLTYENIPDSQARLFVDAHQISYGSVNTFYLPSETLSGMGETLKDYTELSIKWRWSKPPTIESVQTGFSNVSVSLEGSVVPNSPFSVYIPPAPPATGDKPLWFNISYEQFQGTHNLQSNAVSDSNNNVYVLHAYNQGIPAAYFFSFIKYGSDGEILIHKTANLTQDATQLNLIFVHDNLIIAYVRFNANHDLIAFDAAGNIVWQKAYIGTSDGGYGREYSSDRVIKYSPYHNFLYGWKPFGSPYGGGEFHVFALSISDGSLLQSRRFYIPSNYGLQARCMFPRPDGRFTLSGIFQRQYNYYTVYGSGSLFITLSYDLLIMDALDLNEVGSGRHGAFHDGQLVFHDYSRIYYMDFTYQTVRETIPNNFAPWDAQFYSGGGSDLYMISNAFGSADSSGGNLLWKINSQSNKVVYRTWFTESGGGRWDANISKQRFTMTNNTGTFPSVTSSNFEITTTPFYIDNPGAGGNLRGRTQYDPSFSGYNYSGLFTITETTPLGYIRYEPDIAAMDTYPFTEQTPMSLTFFDSKPYYPYLNLTYTE